jgi:hypothetical protein
MTYLLTLPRTYLDICENYYVTGSFHQNETQDDRPFHVSEYRSEKCRRPRGITDLGGWRESDIQAPVQCFNIHSAAKFGRHLYTVAPFMIMNCVPAPSVSLCISRCWTQTPCRLRHLLQCGHLYASHDNRS